MTKPNFFRKRVISPIYSIKQELIEKIKNNDSLVIIGETSCGKTTQIPRLLYYSHIHKGKIIACTQPRRIAAISVAQFVAKEMNCDTGQLVGYSVRFDDTTSSNTKIKYMTDGILLKEAAHNPLLLKYSIIIIDEAHERSLHTDLLLSIIKQAQDIRNQDKTQSYPKLKVIIMSATMDVDKFSLYFNKCPILYIEGRIYPIKTFYSQKSLDEQEFIYNALVTVFQIHCDNGNSERIAIGQYEKVADSSSQHILIFMPGREEVESFISEGKKINRSLEDTMQHHLPKLTFHPLYAGMPSGAQLRSITETTPDSNGTVFRKVIVATNIAETSITIPGIKYVVDTGLFKIKTVIPNCPNTIAASFANAKGTTPFSHRGGQLSCYEQLSVAWISKAQAWQRTGRAGRLAPGYCYRLYTESHFDRLPEYPVPEIVRCDLSPILPQIVAINEALAYRIKNTNARATPFQFFEAPPRENLYSALRSLCDLGVVCDDCETIENEGKDILSKFKLTPTGHLLNAFPIDPMLAKLLALSSGKLHGASDNVELCCSEEMCSIVAVLSSLQSGGGLNALFLPPTKSSRDVIEGSNGKLHACIATHTKFMCAESDHITLLNVIRAFKSNKGDKKWCALNRLNRKSLLSAYKIDKQLRKLCRANGMPMISCGNNYSVVRKVLSIGLCSNFAEVLPKLNCYKTRSYRDNCYIHPSSSLFSLKPAMIVFSELLLTAKPYLRIVSRVDPDWLPEIFPQKTNS